MNPEASQQRRVSLVAPTAGSHACPACLVRNDEAFIRCPSCQFTGGDTMAMFASPPPLPPILDAAGLWSRGELTAIERGVARLTRRFPQFRWRICSVHLPPENRIRLFGFWLMNASPLSPEETPEDRAWTVLLVINTTSNRVAVIPGYSAEPWLPDDQLQRAMESMKFHWRDGRHGKAVCAFLGSAGKLLETNWRRMESSQKW